MPRPTDIWMVYATAGCEYEDHNEWSVCWYASEVLAKVHAEKAQARADEIEKLPLAEALEAANIHDPYYTYQCDVAYDAEILERGDCLGGCVVVRTKG